MACKYVKEFDYTPYKAGGHVKALPKQDGYTRDAKKAAGGVMVGPPTSVAPGHVMAKKGGSAKACDKACNKAKGGVMEKATGERYPSRKEMVKHERSESPRERKEELLQTTEVKGVIPPKVPVRKSVPVASQSPLLAMRAAALKKGGKVSEAKVGKVMGEYKEGKLHSGSKKGPEVTNPKQAIAIALSEGRKAAKKK